MADNWRIDFALTRIKGIGWALSKRILTALAINPATRVNALKPDELAKVTTKLEDFLIGGELTKTVKDNVTRLQTIGAYRGLRHTRNLPVRGQRTRTNARTKRGKRKTIGAFKKEVLSKAKTAAVEEGAKK